MPYLKYYVFFLFILLLTTGCASTPYGDDHGFDLNGQVDIRLDQVTEPAVAEVFGKVVNTARGVKSAMLSTSHIMPDTPQACFALWRVTIDEKQTEPFRLQANILKMINDISLAGGQMTINGVSYRYPASEMSLLKGLRAGDTSRKTIHFILDRELARDREFAGQY